MLNKAVLLTLLIALSISFIPYQKSYGGGMGNDLDVLETDSSARDAVMGFFDLRDRETFMQVTNTSGSQHVFHIQVFNVGNLCNENDFFDSYTINDTHVYNLRDIVTNDGNPSGFELPENAYGVFVAYVVDSDDEPAIVGNMRILDNNGYEYRTNLVGIEPSPNVSGEDISTFNFNTVGGVTLSDIVGFAPGEVSSDNELLFDNVLDTWLLYDIDIYDLNENVFSCRNIVFSCIDESSPLFEELLEIVADDSDGSAASIAAFEYGINDAIPHSKGGKLLCPGNVISEGFVRLNLIENGDETDDETTVFVGLNNGNGRGSMDVFINQSSEPVSGGGGGGGG